MKSQKEAARDLGVTLKGKVGQYFCSHKNKEWFEDKYSWAMPWRKSYLICKDCGKACDSSFENTWEDLK